jgi:enoyl-CoA hydratase/carnithine racemase
MMQPVPVLVERDGDIAIIRMNRPDCSNAVNPDAMSALCDALDDVIADDKIRAIVLGHVGKHFIAGADFAFLEDLKTTATVAVRDEIYAYFQGAAKRIHLCPKPTVAAIGGAAVTVGCELAIACDFRIVTEKAVFQQSWVKLGLIGPLGSMKLLPQIVGWTMAKDMMLRARPVTGAQAVAIGLATELVQEDERERRAIELARELAALPPLAYRATKEALWQGLQASFEDVWATDLLHQSILLGSSDFREGIDAIKARRAPEFHGR